MKVEDCLRVLDTHLAKQDWLAKDYSIADIANWCWVRTYKWSGISIEGLNNLEVDEGYV